MAKFGHMDGYVLGTSWKLYLQKLDFFFKANGINESDLQRNIFLTVCGDSVFAIADSLIKPALLETVTFDELKQKLTEHFSPAPNPIVERFRFNKRNQGDTESMADFVADLRRLSDGCNFSDLDDRLRDRIVCGARDEQLKHRLFEEGAKLTFSKAYEMALASEVAKKSVKDVRSFTLPGNNSVLYKESTKEKNKFRKKEHQDNKYPNQKKSCYRCGEQHSADTCRFSKSTCNFCGKMGHIEKVCITKKHQAGKGKPPTYKAMSSKSNQNNLVQEQEQSPNPAAEHFMYHNFSLPDSSVSKDPIHMYVKLDGRKLEMQIDSGSGHSIISEDTYNRLWPHKPPLTKETILLRTWTKQQLPVLGSFTVNVTSGSKQELLPVLVALGNGPSLMGRDWFQALGISFSTSNHLSDTVSNRHHTLFDGSLGEFKGPPVSITIEPESIPIFRKARAVPFALKESIEAELDRQEIAGILEKVKTSKWATPLVPVLKNNGEIRLCGDYAATVNKVLQKVSYPLPTASEIFTKLAHCTVFSKLDLAYAYLQLSVDEASADLLTLNTTKGLYRVRRLPFGIASAPSIFQQFMDILLMGIKGVAALLDDVIIGGSNEDEHNHRVDNVMERLARAGLKLKQNKCVLGAKSLTFLGFRIDAKGIHPTEEKVEAIHNAPSPKNKQELQAFLGLYNFYERFLPEKSTILEPLHRLLDQKKQWEWKVTHQKAFSMAKDLMKSDAVLTHYDPQKPIILACDASPYGVGAVLSHVIDEQIEKPIAYGSKTLQPAERNYAQIDREALAVIFGVKKFHQYLAGRQFTILTDHKPLLGLLQNNARMPDIISPRMLRWKLLLQAYDYKLEFRPGKKMGNADAFSRLPQPTSATEIPSPAEILLLESEVGVPTTAIDIARETQKDPVLSRVKIWTLKGWPEDCQEQFTPFSRRKTELSVHQNCLLWGNRVVIPVTLRSDMLKLLHATHQGIVRTKATARSYMWWPKMDQEIELLTKQCTTCQLTRNNPPRMEPQRWIKSTNPWSRVHIDFAGPFQDKVFLILVDSYSKWPEVKIMNSMTSEAVIKALREIFATHGLPDILVSDNGTAFTSEIFRQFMNKNGIRHIFTPPYHPSSNGLAERMVQTVKGNLCKFTGDWSTRISRMLIALRNTPCMSTGMSPAEALMRRRPRTLLDRIHPDNTFYGFKNQNELQWPKRSININDPVFLRDYQLNKTKWIPGVVTEKSGPVMYEVTAVDGRVQRRHIDQLMQRFPIPVEQGAGSRDPEEALDEQSFPEQVSAEEAISPRDDPTPSGEPASVEVEHSQVSSTPACRPVRVRRPPRHLNDYV